MSEVKRAVLEFVKAYYEERRKAPSVKLLCENVKGLSRRKFYEVFVGGIAEACRLAGVPEPDQRIRATEHALSTREKPTAEEVSTSGKLILTEEQTKRLWGISHLEKGRDPLLLVDELLDRDVALRKKGLSIAQTKQVSDYIDKALERGWQIPWLLDIQTKLWNLGIMSLTEEDGKSLLTLYQEVKSRKWDVK